MVHGWEKTRGELHGRGAMVSRTLQIIMAACFEKMEICREVAE